MVKCQAKSETKFFCYTSEVKSHPPHLWSIDVYSSRMAGTSFVKIDMSLPVFSLLKKESDNCWRCLKSRCRMSIAARSPIYVNRYPHKVEKIAPSIVETIQIEHTIASILAFLLMITSSMSNLLTQGCTSDTNAITIAQNSAANSKCQ